MPKYVNKCPEQNEIDVYSHCHFNCIYCIAGDPAIKPDKRQNPVQLIDTDDNHLPFYLSPWTECYPPEEHKSGKTRHILEKLNKKEASYFVITKGTGVYRDADLFRNREKTFVAFSLNTADFQTQQFLEPDAPNCFERMDLIEYLIHEQGIKVVVKIDPIIPGITDKNQLSKLIKWLKKVKPFAITSETLRVTKTIAKHLKSNLPVNFYNKLMEYYPSPNESPQHPPLTYRTNLFYYIRDEFLDTDTRTAFCKATLPEPINSNDCRGGFNI